MILGIKRSTPPRWYWVSNSLPPNPLREWRTVRASSGSDGGDTDYPGGVLMVEKYRKWGGEYTWGVLNVGGPYFATHTPSVSEDRKHGLHTYTVCTTRVGSGSLLLYSVLTIPRVLTIFSILTYDVVHARHRRCHHRWGAPLSPNLHVDQQYDSRTSRVTPFLLDKQNSAVKKQNIPYAVNNGS